MAEAGFMQALMTAAMNNPDVFFLGLAIGGLVAWWKTKNKYKNQGMMGMP